MLEGDPAKPDLVDRMFGRPHAGSSRMVELRISHIAHRLEDIMVLVREARCRIPGGDSFRGADACLRQTTTGSTGNMLDLRAQDRLSEIAALGGAKPEEPRSRRDSDT
jgi:chemotaxis protein histidine kinase CheA